MATVTHPRIRGGGGQCVGITQKWINKKHPERGKSPVFRKTWKILLKKTSQSKQKCENVQRKKPANIPTNMWKSTQICQAFIRFKHYIITIRYL